MDNNGSSPSIFLSVTSAIAYAFGCFTQANIAFALSIVAAIIAIYSGLVTIREKRLSIKKLRNEINDNKFSKN